MVGMKKLLSKFRIVVPVLMCVFAFTTLMLTGCKDEQPHVHNLELISEKIATCTETGEREHYHCTLCDKNYLTEQAETEVSAEDLVIEIDTDNHNYDFATAVYDFHLKTGSESDYECTATVSCSRNAEHAKITETVDATVHVDDADCTTDGEKNFTAEFENKAFGVNGFFSKTEPISAYGHNYGTIIPEVSATCLAEGTHAHYHCDRCGNDFLQKDGVVATAQDLTIAKLEHNMEHNERVEATCVLAGHIEYWHCSSCNKNYRNANGGTEVSAEDLVIAIKPDNHNYDYTTAVYDFHLKAGSETEYECTATVSCSRNTEHAKITETVDATVQVTPADCTTAGEKVLSAEFSNKKFGENGVVSKTEPISALGHNYGTIIAEVPVTCLAEGTKAHYHCDRCDKDFLQQNGVVATAQDLTIAKLDHNMTHYESNEATCESTGNIEYWHCSSCNKNYSDANGETEVNNVILEKLSHSMTHHARNEATCESTGNVEYWSCSSCNKNYSDEKGENEVKDIVIPANGHSYGDLIPEVPATCTQTGVKAHYVCSVCNKNFDADKTELQDLTIAKLDHNMTHYESNEATCESTGNIEYWHCSSCNKNYSDANGETEVENTVVKALGHNYQKEDETFNYVYDYDNSRYVAKCTRCEHTNTTKVQTAGVEGYPYLANNEATLLSAVEKGGYIKLADNIAVEGVVVISTSVNIDLNEKTISYTQTAADNNGSGERKNYCILNFTGGNSVVSNGAITYNTSITEGVDEGRAISIENDAQLVMQGLVITSDLRGVMVFDNSQTSIINCEITSNMDTISGNNTWGPSTKNLIVNVQNSTITSTNLTAVFMPSYITLNITSNSTVTGKTSAIYAMMGVINVDETSALSSTRGTFVARQDAPVSEEDTSNQLKGQGPGDESYDGATIVLRTNYYYDSKAETNGLTLSIADWDKVTATSGVKVAVYNFAEDSSFITDAKNNGKHVTNQFVEVCNKLTAVDGVKYFLYGTEKVYNETNGTYENQAKLVELSYYQYWLANYAEVEVVNEETIEYAIIDDHWLFEEVDAIESGFKYGYSFVEQTIINKTKSTTTVDHMFVEWSQKDIKNCGGIDGSLIAFVMSDSSEKFFKVPTDELNLKQRTLIEGHYIGVKDNDKASVLAFTDDCIMINELGNGDYEIQGLFNFDLNEETRLITVTIEGSYRYFYLDENTFTVEEYACRVTNEYGEIYDEYYYFTLEEALLHIDENTTITLLKDITITQSILIQPETPVTINLNLNGKTLKLDVANENDSISFSGVRTSLYDGTIVTNSSLYPIRIISGSNVTVSNLTINGNNYGCFRISNSEVELTNVIASAKQICAAVWEKSNVTIKDCNFTGIGKDCIFVDDSTVGLSNVTAKAIGTCVTVWKDANVTIEDCNFTSDDNGVIMDNGSEGLGNNTVVIRGTTLNAHIKTSGYIACGIYHANSGKWTIGANSNGKNSVINVYSGAGIVARSGDFVIENGVVFNHFNTEHPDLKEGKVGDAKINIVIPVDIYRDLAANYPGGKPNVITNNSKVCEALQTQFECVDGEEYYYTSFEKLIAELNGDKTITLLKDLSLQEKLSISPEKTCEIVLDLGGHTINGGAMTSGSMIHVMGCTLTIKNGNIVSENAGVGAIRVQGREGADSASKMDNPVAVNTNLILTDTLNVTSKSYCLFIFGSGAVVETSANLTNNSTEANVPAVIQTNGNSGCQIGSLTIKGGTITHNTDVALYLPSAGTYIIEGGTIIGSSAVYVKCGTLTITGGTLKATASRSDFVHNGNGCNYTGDALVVEACNYPGGVPTVNINGGTFTIVDKEAYQVGVYNYDGYEAIINNNTDIVITTEKVFSQS